jgi:hypothetical protein
MSGLGLQMPDGSILPVNGVTTLGRGHPPALSDSCLSRHHLLLTPLEGQPGVALLTNQGQNGEKYEGSGEAIGGRGDPTQLPGFPPPPAADVRKLSARQYVAYIPKEDMHEKQ